MAKEVPHCIACGKPVEKGDDSAHTTFGEISVSGKHKPKTEFGVYHRSCHNRSVMIPSAVRDELSRQHRHTTR